MAELKEPLLPPRPVGIASRALFHAPEISGLKKRGQGVKSWIRVGTNAVSELLDADKFTIMRRCDLPARDLRLLDPLFDYPSTILGREKAIVVNLEQIRCIITADEVLLLNCVDIYVLQYVEELQRRLAMRSHVCDSNMWQSRPQSSRHEYKVDVSLGTEQMRNRSGGAHYADYFSGSSADNLPFEFRALEVALEAACTYLDTQATELEIEAYPLLDDLINKISTLNLERARRLKSRLVALTRRVQKVRDEIEHLMDDDGDMAEMYLTEKKERAEERSEERTEERVEDRFCRDQSLLTYSSLGAGGSVSAPVSPVHSPTDFGKLEKRLSLSRSRRESSDAGQKLEKQLSFACSRHESTDSGRENIAELEMLLEAYFVVIDSTLNKLTSINFCIVSVEAERCREDYTVYAGCMSSRGKFPRCKGASSVDCVIFTDTAGLKEYIDDTEDFINIQLDNVRNQLIQFELLLTTATFVVTIFSVIAGIFGMNFPIGLFEQPQAFKWVLLGSGLGGILIFSSFLWYFRHRRLMPL